MPFSSSFIVSEVLVSFALSFISAYNAVCFADIFRYSLKRPSKTFSSTAILIFMSIAIGGGAIWSMHFSGMAALQIKNENGERITLHYNTGVTIVSLIVAIICVYVGLYISSLDRVYTKDKDELFQMLLEDAKNYSLKAVQNKHHLYRLAALKGVHHLAFGGLVTGGGVCIMHYVGMMALTAHLSIKWNPGLVIFSVIIAVVASTVAFWILFRLLPLFQSYESLRLGSSFIMAIAVCGMHYTGMMAATYSPSSDLSGYAISSTSISNENAYLGAYLSSLLLNWIFSMIIQSELRHYTISGFKHSKELQKLYEKYPDDKPNSKAIVNSSHMSSSHPESHSRPIGTTKLKTLLTTPLGSGSGGVKIFAVKQSSSQANTDLC